MDWGAYLVYAFVFSLLVFFIQRSEAKRRLLVLLIMLIPAVIMRNIAVNRDIEAEAWWALGTALFLNFMFWVLIGRYNPVPSSDDIRVLGLDD